MLELVSICSLSSSRPKWKYIMYTVCIFSKWFRNPPSSIFYQRPLKMRAFLFALTMRGKCSHFDLRYFRCQCVKRIRDYLFEGEGVISNEQNRTWPNLSQTQRVVCWGQSKKKTWFGRLNSLDPSREKEILAEIRFYLRPLMTFD